MDKWFFGQNLMIHRDTSPNQHSCACTCVSVCARACVVSVYASIGVCVHMCVYVRFSVCTCVCMCISVYAGMCAHVWRKWRLTQLSFVMSTLIFGDKVSHWSLGLTD